MNGPPGVTAPAAVATINPRRPAPAPRRVEIFSLPTSCFDNGLRATDPITNHPKGNDEADKNEVCSGHFHERLWLVFAFPMAESLTQILRRRGQRSSPDREAFGLRNVRNKASKSSRCSIRRVRSATLTASCAGLIC